MLEASLVSAGNALDDGLVGAAFVDLAIAATRCTLIHQIELTSYHVTSVPNLHVGRYLGMQ